jgi:hypothetical protein
MVVTIALCSVYRGIFPFPKLFLFTYNLSTPLGQNGPTPRFSIWRPRALHEGVSSWRTLRYDATCHHRFPRELPPPSFETQTRQNPLLVALGGFEAQTTKRVSRQSSITLATWPALPRPRVSACPRCQSPRSVTLLLQSISQVWGTDIPRVH